VIVRTNHQLGAAIKGRRQELGLTQRKLAEKIDMTTRALIEIESGKGNPRMSSLLNCLDALGMEMIIEPTPSNLERNALGIFKRRGEL